MLKNPAAWRKDFFDKLRRIPEWYPPQVTPTVPDRSVTWDGLQRSLPRYFDIEAETTYLKQHPERFEELRNNYPYRTEYF